MNNQARPVQYFNLNSYNDAAEPLFQQGTIKIEDDIEKASLSAVKDTIDNTK